MYDSTEKMKKKKIVNQIKINARGGQSSMKLFHTHHHSDYTGDIRK